MNKNIAYIIPLHKKDEKVLRAIGSVPKDSLVIVSTNGDIAKWLKSKKIKFDCEVTFKINEKTSYSSLVNSGILYLPDNIDYVNILEFDDTVTPNANSVIEKYGEDWDSVDILAPLACIVKYNEDDDKPTLVGITNEASMAPQMAEEFGVFDFNMMLRTNFVFVNGCYIKPKVFKDYGLFKENFEMFYDYEWVLRMVYNGVIIKSVPMSTHFHTLTEDGAFESHKKVSRETIDKWLSCARREYFFDEDRPINI